MRILRKHRKSEEINMGPLVDMVFLLLIFFAVSTTFAKDMKLELERPKAGKTQNPASSKAIRVFVDRGGNVFVDEQPVKAWMLQSRIRDLLGVSSDAKVLVIADRLITAEKLIGVVDDCRAGGAEEVAVATEAGAE